jgi:TPR repeat protein
MNTEPQPDYEALLQAQAAPIAQAVRAGDAAALRRIGEQLRAVIRGAGRTAPPPGPVCRMLLVSRACLGAAEAARWGLDDPVCCDPPSPFDSYEFLAGKSILPPPLPAACWAGVDRAEQRRALIRLCRDLSEDLRPYGYPLALYYGFLARMSAQFASLEQALQDARQLEQFCRTVFAAPEPAPGCGEKREEAGQIPEKSSGASDTADIAFYYGMWLAALCEDCGDPNAAAECRAAAQLQEAQLCRKYPAEPPATAPGGELLQAAARALALQYDCRPRRRCTKAEWEECVSTGRKIPLSPAEREQNLRRALYWYRRAADCGSTEAMRAAGSFFRYGCGTRRDAVLAYYWYHRAANAGDIFARGLTAECCRHGIGTPRSSRAAECWYQRVLTQKNYIPHNPFEWAALPEASARAALRLGWLMLVGRGYPAAPAEIRRTFSAAAAGRGPAARAAQRALQDWAGTKRTAALHPPQPDPPDTAEIAMQLRYKLFLQAGLTQTFRKAAEAAKPAAAPEAAEGPAAPGGPAKPPETLDVL